MTDGPSEGLAELDRLTSELNYLVAVLERIGEADKAVAGAVGPALANYKELVAALGAARARLLS
jgi:hypothetical protein